MNIYYIRKFSSSGVLEIFGDFVFCFKIIWKKCGEVVLIYLIINIEIIIINLLNLFSLRKRKEYIRFFFFFKKRIL